MLLKFKKFVQDHIPLLLFNTMLVAISYGSRVFSANVAVDTDIFMTNPYTNYNWLDIGRWGLVLLKKIVNRAGFSVYYEGIMAFIVMIMFLMVYNFLFESISNKKCNHYIFSALFITHPIFVYQWFFKLQAFEIALSILFIPISLLLIFDWLEDKNLISLFIGSCFMLISFACYQTNVILYISSAVFCYMLKYKELKDFKEILMICLKLIGSFVAVYVVNTIITKLFFSSSSYLNDTITWDFNNIGNNIRVIMGHVKEVVLGTSITMNKAYLVIVMLSLLMFVLYLNKMNIYRFFMFFVTVCFLITPFLLALYTGSYPYYRSMYVLPFVIAAMFMYLYSEYENILKNKKIIKTVMIIICCFFTLSQVKVTNKLWYTDDVRYEQDCMMINSIMFDMKKDSLNYMTKPVVFIGEWNAPLNPQCYGEVDFIGRSYFKNVVYVEPYYFYSTDSIRKLSIMQGNDFKSCSPNDCKKAREYAKTMNIYPQKGYVQEYEDIIVVKVSEDLIVD